MKFKNNGGGTARRICPISHSNRLVYVRYLDHAQCWNTDPTLAEVNVREAVGWLTFEEDDFLVLTSDRSWVSLPHEIRENFLIIIKMNIQEKREIKLAP
jgi:hypothetical protein